MPRILTEHNELITVSPEELAKMRANNSQPKTEKQSDPAFFEEDKAEEMHEQASLEAKNKKK